LDTPVLVHASRGWKKIFAILLLDLFLYNSAIFFAILVKNDFIWLCPVIHLWTIPWLIENLFFIVLTFTFGIPFEIWGFTSLREAFKISLVVYSVKLSSYPIYLLFLQNWQFSLAIFIISTIIAFPLIVLPRAIYRLLWERNKRILPLRNDEPECKPKQRTRLLIVGAGAAAEKVLREIEEHPELNYLVVGLVDDNRHKLGSTLRRKRVLGSIYDMPQIIDRNLVQEVLIAMPSVKGDVFRRILVILAPTQVKVKTLPGIWEMVDGTVSTDTIRTVKVEDLLERDPIHTNIQEIGAYLQDQVVLVTGAGGSIGAELVRQIIPFKPALLLMLGRGENRIFEIEHEVRDKLKFDHAVPIIADIRDIDKVKWLFERYRPSIVFHAAAHKHVPLMEQNPDEVITNNILGTRNLLEQAYNCHVKRFINISTDKAVHPSNVMGASKRIIELMISAYNQKNSMICTSVRFGNVLGSNGSVIQVFGKQLKQTRTIKVTDKAMERFFMLIPEAVELVLQAGALAKGNDVFVLKMGNQVNIYEFAKSYIKLSGLELGKSAFIEIVGNRGNEKLSEELWSKKESPQNTANPWILKVECPIDGSVIEQYMQKSKLFTREICQLPSEQIKSEIYQFLKAIDS
jgi:FlaA1/EpsC-like NDP-sugar epimerase